MSRVFFTSDHHFGHARVIEYASRTWARTVEEMNEKLIDRWNSTVSPDDTVYHLGDFALIRPDKAAWIASRLNGTKHILWGNHDKNLRDNKDFLAQFTSSADLKTVRVPDPSAPGGSQIVVLCHYAMRVWDRSHYGTWSLFGHSHGSMPDDRHSLSMDVGVDCHDGYPVPYEVVRERMGRKKWKPVDNHGRSNDA